MNLDDLTLGQIEEIKNIFSAETVSNINNDMQHGAIGKKCIVRTYASGVHFGTPVFITTNDGRSRCELKDSRRLWYWKSSKSISLSGVAVHGIVQKDSKICPVVEQIFIEDAIEFIPCTDDAIKSIEGTKDYEV